MLDINKLKQEQLKFAKKIITIDLFDQLKIIGGVDFAYIGDECICAIVLCDVKSMKVVEKVHHRGKLSIPYIKGFLIYRLGALIVETYSKLNQKPDLLVLPCHGISHPRKIGLASHMGITLDVATIGIAKELLAGEKKGNIVYIEKEAVAEKIITRESAKPLYISPGHKISLRTSVKVIKDYMRYPHKMPEPLHLAHKYAKSLINANDKD